MKSTLKLIAASAAIVGAGAFQAVASNGKVCATHDTVEQRLMEKFGESVRSVGRTSSDYTVELFASRQYDTWTLTVTKPGGLTCLVSSGSGFETVPRNLAQL